MPKPHFKELRRDKSGGRSGILNIRAGKLAYTHNPRYLARTCEQYR